MVWLYRSPDPFAAEQAMTDQVNIQVSRKGRSWHLTPRQFEAFPLENGDELIVLPPELASKLPCTGGDISVEIAPGHAIRVPPRFEIFEFKGSRLPVHLVTLTGAGPDTFDQIARVHIEHYQKFVGLSPEMTILEVGCGIGRDAFQLFDFLSPLGRYIGVDVTRDSIEWCRANITPRHPNFTFHHIDAYSELYNPRGRLMATECTLRCDDRSVDRIVLASVFTHMLEHEVLHYMREFRRVLRPDGLVYANFFLYSPEALEAAKTKGTTPWKATFAQHYGGGVYGNDPQYPRGAVAYSDDAMQRLISAAGLRLVRPYIKGWWSGLHENPEDGQDAAILGLPSG
jgi:SAM-dependent methyltransferase